MGDSVQKARLAGRLARTAARFGPAGEQLAATRLPWYEVRAQGDSGGGDVGDGATVLIYEEIGGSLGVTAEDFARDLAKIGAPVITVRINSPGGSLFDALAIHSTLLAHPARIHVVVDGIAASAASVIAMAGDRVTMMPGSQLMIHDASAVADGNAGEMSQMATFLNRQSDNIADLYARRAGGDRAEWRELMLAETWMFSGEAVEMRLADTVWQAPVPAATDPAMTRAHDLTKYQYRYAGRRSAPQPRRRSAAAGRIAMSHDHTTGPQQRGAIPVHHTATSEDSFDGPGSEARIPNDAGKATLRRMYAWVDPDKDPDTKAAYKFGHHDVNGQGEVGAANLRGCSTGIAELNGGRGGANIPDGDREGVHAHLAAHLKDGQKEPPPLQPAGAGGRARAMARQLLLEGEDGERMLAPASADRRAAATARGEAAERRAHQLAQAGRQVPVLRTAPEFRTQMRVMRSETPVDVARIQGFRSRMQRAGTVMKGGRELVHLAGYASMYNMPYDMWDDFGPYQEFVASRAGADSLANNPDVAFLVNHTGVTMARTTNGTLLLAEDGDGLADDAYVNGERSDVQILLSAVDDELVDEQSFAFMVDEGLWSEDFETYQIVRYNINRGDVSGVNYGANPFTSIGARSQDVMRTLQDMPAGMARAAFDVLARRRDVVDLRYLSMPESVREAVVDHDDEDLVVAVSAMGPGSGEPTGRRITAIEAMFDL